VAISGLVPGPALQTSSRLAYAYDLNAHVGTASNALNAFDDAPSAPYLTRLRCSCPSLPA
jgi:hypothetical protein